MITARGETVWFLVNMVGNAVKLPPHGEVAVGVALESSTAEPNVKLRFTVRATPE